MKDWIFKINEELDFRKKKLIYFSFKIINYLYWNSNLTLRALYLFVTMRALSF